jgi:hypothetical protein
MPRPFIVLENHLSSAARQFIATNSASFWALGYRKFLLEMDASVSPEACKIQLQTILANPAVSFLHPSSRALLDWFTALDTIGIDYAFIDPERQAEALEHNTQLMLRTAPGSAQTFAERERLVALRDESMASEITRQAALYGGGIIFLGGYLHASLPRGLVRQRAEFRCAVIMDRTLTPGLSMHSEHSIDRMREEAFRNRFYGSTTHFFDLADGPSFPWIEAVAELTPSAPCDPSVGQCLSRSTGQTFRCVVDAYGVVSASAEMTEEQLKATVSTMTTHFPMLRLLTLRRGESSRLNIPGINLPENTECLMQGFMRLDTT